MEQAYIRKVQLSGGSTLIVSLPKEWVRAVGIKKMDEVYVVPQQDGTLFIMPKRSVYDEATIIVSENITPDALLKDFISYYLAGYGLIRVKLERPLPQFIQKLKESIRRWLIGIEVIEESSIELVTQCLNVYVNMPIKKTIERMSKIALSMQKEAIMALSKSDVTLAREIIQRDDEVDRLYHLLVRQLNMAVSSPVLLESLGISNRQDCLSYIMAAKSIERSADHAMAIARLVESIDKDVYSIPSQLEDIGNATNDVFGRAIKALLEENTKLANEVIQMVYGLTEEMESMDIQFSKPSMDHKISTLARFVLSNLRRIAEYSEDISEVVFNLCVKKPSFYRASNNLQGSATT